MRHLLQPFSLLLLLSPVVSADEYIQEDRTTMFATSKALGVGCFFHAGNQQDFCGPSGAYSKALWGKTTPGGFASFRLEGRGDFIFGEAESNSDKSAQLSASIMATGNLMLIPMGPKAALGIDAGVGYAAVLQTGQNRALFSALQFYSGYGFHVKGHYFGLQFNALIGVYGDNNFEDDDVSVTEPCSGNTNRDGFCDNFSNGERALLNGLSVSMLVKYARPF